MYDSKPVRGTAFTDELEPMRAGVCMYAAGSIAAGMLDLIWRDFDAGHQPIQALGDYIPGREILAFVAGIWLVAGGGAILWRRTARGGAVALAAIYLVFGLFWLPRFYTAPHIVGFRAGVFIGLLVGVGQQLILVAAAVIVYASLSKSGPERTRRVSLALRCTFGLASIDFGLAHMTGVQAVSSMVPKWIPFGGEFWAILTGCAFVLGGIAVLTGILDVLAARLLALMLLMFSALVLAPGALAHRQNHVPWGSNAYNLAAVGAFLLCAESILTRRRVIGRGVGREYGPNLEEMRRVDVPGSS
jgi:uncharacterized membrane protein